MLLIDKTIYMIEIWVSSISEMILTWADSSIRKKILSQCNFVHHKPHMDWPGIAPGPLRWKTGA